MANKKIDKLKIQGVTYDIVVGQAESLKNLTDGEGTGSLQQTNVEKELVDILSGSVQPKAKANGAAAFGYATEASGKASFATGIGTTASGDGAHAEGNSTTASVLCAHAEGARTTASGAASHAEGSFRQ